MADEPCAGTRLCCYFLQPVQRPRRGTASLSDAALFRPITPTSEWCKLTVCERDLSRLASLLKCDTTWLPSAVLSRPCVEHRSPVMRAEISPLPNGSPDCNPEKAPQPRRSQQVGDCCCTPVAALGFMCSRASDEKRGRARWAEDSAFSSACWNQIFSFPASACHLWGLGLT